MRQQSFAATLGRGASAAECIGWVRSVRTFAALGMVALIAGCARGGSPPIVTHRLDSQTGTSASPRLYAQSQSIPKGGGTYKLGSPYRVAGRWYVPTEDPRYDRNGLASWYGADFHGRKTANGEIFDMGALTAAHPTLPLPSYAYVTSHKTGRTVLVRINDRGPYAADRIMDLSKATAELLGVAGAGVSEVRVVYAGRAPLDGNDRAEQRFLASQPWARTAVASQEHNGRAGRMGVGLQ